MKRADRNSPATSQIAALLGSVPLPGSVQQFADAMATRTANVMRLRRAVAADDLPLPSEPIRWYSLGRRPTVNAPRPSQCLAFAAGDYYVQDAGSLLALAAARADSGALCGKRICDLCAAPGGKATALVEAVGDQGFVLANEAIGSRRGALQLNLARTRSDRWAVSQLDPADLADRLGAAFDLVLVDAPCSGQAMLGRGRQGPAAWSGKQIAHSAARQTRILAAAARLVRCGGGLIYSTCTFSEAENEAQIARLIDSGVAIPAPVESLADYETNAGCYRLWPHQHSCGGSFAASLRIVNSAADQPARLPTAEPPEDLYRVLGDWYSLPATGQKIVRLDSVLLGWPRDLPAWTETMAVSGPELAHRVGQTWRPSHAGALRQGTVISPTRRIDIDDDGARNFMRGEAIQCTANGWHVVCWRGRPLGWVKADGRTGKNHLPKSARIPGQLIS